MRRFVVLVPLLASLAALACGPGDEKPPLTPDPSTPPALDDAGAAPPPGAASPPSK
jgi:hypothetical protein